MVKELIVAFGDVTYRINRAWAQPPESLKLGTFSKCVCDVDGSLYVTHRGEGPVLIFDASGKFVRCVGEGNIIDPHGLYLLPGGEVLVVDRDVHQVKIFDARGKQVGAIGEANKPRFQKPFSHPTDVTVDGAGRIFVADGYGNAMVHRFTSNGDYELSWGGFGAGPGQFATPHGIEVYGDGRLMVGDRENGRVQIFTPDGVFVEAWTGFYNPMDLHVSGELVYVSDGLPSVQARDPSGNVVGRCKPALAMPHGITGDSRGNFFVVETRNSIITKLEQC